MLRTIFITWSIEEPDILTSSLEKFDGASEVSSTESRLGSITASVGQRSILATKQTTISCLKPHISYPVIKTQPKILQNLICNVSECVENVQTADQRYVTHEK